MRFALMIEAQQGLTYEDQLAIARRAEAAGFETLFRSDHYASFPGGSDQVTSDAWAVPAGLEIPVPPMPAAQATCGIYLLNLRGVPDATCLIWEGEASA